MNMHCNNSILRHSDRWSTTRWIRRSPHIVADAYFRQFNCIMSISPSLCFPGLVGVTIMLPIYTRESSCNIYRFRRWGDARSILRYEISSRIYVHMHIICICKLYLNTSAVLSIWHNIGNTTVYICSIIIVIMCVKSTIKLIFHVDFKPIAI